VCALVRAATRFLPVPFLDDAVAERATRIVVSRTLRAAGRRYPATALQALYADEAARRRGLLRRAARKILLFPVRKYSKVITAVHGVPNDVARVLLLGRATHRRLALGELSSEDPAQLAREATDLRGAYEAVVDEMDLKLLRGAISDGLGQVKDLTSGVLSFARRRFTTDADEAEAGVQGPEGAVAEGAEQVQRALERPEIVRLLAEFDRRMDARLARSTGRLRRPPCAARPGLTASPPCLPPRCAPGPRLLERLAHGAVRRGDRGVHGLFARRARSRGWHTSVVAFPGYAVGDRVRVLGRALLAPPGPPGDDLGHRGWRRLLTQEEPGAEVDVVVGTHVRRVRCDVNGLLDASLEVPGGTGGAPVLLRVPDREPVEAPVRVFDADATAGVVCDVDDTVWLTGIRHPWRAAWRTFAQTGADRRPVHGMDDLLQHLVSGAAGTPAEGTAGTEDDVTPGIPVVYLSNGPWNMAPPLVRFLAGHGFPPGALLMTDWGLTPDRWFRDGQAHKRGSMAQLRRELPGVRWSLVGDDGEHDPDLYIEAARDAPDRVAGGPAATGGSARRDQAERRRPRRPGRQGPRRPGTGRRGAAPAAARAPGRGRRGGRRAHGRRRRALVPVGGAARQRPHPDPGLAGRQQGRGAGARADVLRAARRGPRGGRAGGPRHGLGLARRPRRAADGRRAHGVGGAGGRGPARCDGQGAAVALAPGRLPLLLRGEPGPVRGAGRARRRGPAGPAGPPAGEPPPEVGRHPPRRRRRARRRVPRRDRPGPQPPRRRDARGRRAGAAALRGPVRLQPGLARRPAEDLRPRRP
jgi:phosphatidate phosphatase APP1